MTTIIFFYAQIVKAVVGHEAALKAQAKKMNVESLRSNAVRPFYLCEGFEGFSFSYTASPLQREERVGPDGPLLSALRRH